MQLEFVNKQLSTNVQLSLPFHTVLLRNLGMFLVLGLLIALVASIQPLLVNPNLWFAIAMVSFGVCI
jgi:hypothetical protein